MNEKPQVFRAITTALLGLVVFGAAYSLSYLLVGGLMILLFRIPVVSKLLSWLFYKRGDSPDLMLLLLAPTLGYYATTALQDKINGDTLTKGLSCIIIGAMLITLHLFFLILNLILGENILPNISQIIAGIAILWEGIGKFKYNS